MRPYDRHQNQQYRQDAISSFLQAHFEFRIVDLECDEVRSGHFMKIMNMNLSNTNLSPVIMCLAKLIRRRPKIQIRRKAKKKILHAMFESQ